MSPPLLPTNSAYPYPPLPQSSTPGDPKSEDDWLDHQPLIDDPSPTPTTPTPYQHRNSPHSLSLNGWRRVWLTLALALVGLVGLDLARTTATPKTKLVYSNAVDQSALAKHFGYNPDEKVVVLYVYHDSDDAMANAKFFIDHALHDRADFIFILNGESTLKTRIPINLPNIRVIDRPNTCYDLGAHGEVLLANNSEIANKYDKFILMNASVRGPFMPRWSRDCWTDAFTSRVTDKVKLVGLTMNCLDGVESLPRPGLQSTAKGMDSLHRLRHLQAMMLATDQVGVRLLLDPLGLDACHSDYDIAVASEVRLTMLVERAGFEVDALMSMFGQGERFAETCMTQDPMEWYPGGYLPLHETLFAKTKRLPSELVDRYSDWARKYSSYEACRQF